MLNVIQSREGETIYLESEKIFLTREKGKWIEKKINPKLSLSQYEINKMMIKQLPFLTEEEKEDKIRLINNWKIEHFNYYYMLLGKENNYYTIFATDRVNCDLSLGEGVINCLDNVGKIYSIEKDGNKIEIWIEYDNEPIVMYLFPYDEGVVTIGE